MLQTEADERVPTAKKAFERRASDVYGGDQAFPSEFGASWESVRSALLVC